MSTQANKKLKEWILSHPNASTGDKIQYVLDLLRETLLNARGESHGDFSAQMRHTEYLWNVLDSGDVGRPINPRVPLGARSCFKNQLQKMSRATSGAFNFDDFLDNAGYAIGAAVAAVNHYTPGPGGEESREAVASEESREAVAQELEYIITANTTDEPPEEVYSQGEKPTEEPTGGPLEGVYHRYSQEALLTASREFKRYVTGEVTNSSGGYNSPHEPNIKPMSLVDISQHYYIDEKTEHLLVGRVDNAEAWRVLEGKLLLILYTPWADEYRWSTIVSGETHDGRFLISRAPLRLTLRGAAMTDVTVDAIYTPRPDIKEVYPQQQFNPS